MSEEQCFELNKEHIQLDTHAMSRARFNVRDMINTLKLNKGKKKCKYE